MFGTVLWVLWLLWRICFVVLLLGAGFALYPATNRAKNIVWGTWCYIFVASSRREKSLFYKLLCTELYIAEIRVIQHITGLIDPALKLVVTAIKLLRLYKAARLGQNRVHIFRNQDGQFFLLGTSSELIELAYSTVHSVGTYREDSNDNNN